jgi:Fe-S cluster biogenesis protein NfuA
MSAQNGTYSLEDQLKGLIDQLDAYIGQYHGGSVELASFDGKVVKVRLGGGLRGLSAV